MSRRRKVVLTIIPALLLLGLFLLAACDFNPPPPPAKKEPSKGAATQETTSSPGTNASPGDRADDASVPSAGGAIGDTTPPAGEDADSTAPEDATATQKVAPWSDPEDYEYYSKYPFRDKRYESIKELMRAQIVPQAVEALLRTFPKTFGYLRDWAVGVGLNVTYMDYDRETEASFKLGLNVDPDVNKASHTTYSMMVNMASSSIDLIDGMQLDSARRTRLEYLCVHELMHAMMHEALTCGMSGFDVQGEDTTPFPNWFKEGTAEAACGSRLSQIIKIDDNADQIKEALQQYPLTGNSTTSEYTVGWFAVMYLAYLADGQTAVTPDALAKGLDTFLYEIHSGTSLSDAIKKYSGNSYSNLADFEGKFAQDDNVASFIQKLAAAIEKDGAKGQGSLVTGDFSVTDILPDEQCESALFWIYTESDTYTNRYGNALNIKELIEGGAATYTGVPGAAVNPPTPEVLE